MKHCDQCSKPLTIGISTMSPRVVRCSLINGEGLSKCQKAKNKESAQVSRDSRTEQGIANMYEERTKPKTNNDIAIRICLKCGGEFASKGLHNRICETCKDINEGLDVVNLSRIESKVDNIHDYDDIINEITLDISEDVHA